MDIYKRANYLLAKGEMGQLTSAELRTELASLTTQMEADPESQPDPSAEAKTSEPAPPAREY